MRTRVTEAIRNNKGRNPRGYGLPSLVVILFFVSILIQAVIGQMVRETTEAKAEAAFSIAKENLDTFKITSDLPNAADMPHLSAGSRYVTVSRTGGLVNVDFEDADERASRLFDQKLRGYVNIENSQSIGTLAASEIRREYPERILRSGDRMATNLTSDTINNADTLRTGTGDAQFGDTNRFIGIDTTLIETDRFEVVRLRTDKTVVENDTVANQVIANESVVSDVVVVSGTSGHGTYGNGDLLVNHLPYGSAIPVSQRTSRIDNIALSGQLASGNGLDGFDGAGMSITFDQLNASGIRVADLYENVYIAPGPGQPDTPTDPDEPGGDTGGDDTGGGDGGGSSPGTGDTGGSDGGGDTVPEFLTPEETYELCMESNGTNFECEEISGGFDPDTGSGLPPYYQCIDQGGSPLFCEYITSGDTDNDTIYDECVESGRDPVYCTLLDRYEPEPYVPEKPVDDGHYTAGETCVRNGNQDFICGLLSRGYDGTAETCANDAFAGSEGNPNWFFDLQVCKFVVFDGGGAYDTYEPHEFNGETPHSMCLLQGGSDFICAPLIEFPVMQTDWNTPASAYDTCLAYGEDPAICGILSNGFASSRGPEVDMIECYAQLSQLDQGAQYCRFIIEQNVPGYDPGTVGSAYEQCRADGGGYLCAPLLPRLYYDNLRDCLADGYGHGSCIYGGLVRQQ